MSCAQFAVEEQRLNHEEIVASRYEPSEGLDKIHYLQDGSYVYEECWLDFDDETCSKKIFRTLRVSNASSFNRFRSNMWEDSDWEV